MCIEPKQSDLNPEAEEWRPLTLTLLPTPLPSPSPAHVVHHVSLTAELFVTNQNHSMYYSGCPTLFRNEGLMIYTPYLYPPAVIPQPSGDCFLTAIDGGAKDGVEKNPSRIRYFGKGSGKRRSFLPPRLRRVEPSFHVSTPKVEWKPKASASPTPPHAAQGDGSGLTRPPQRPRADNSSKTTIMIKNIPNQLRRDFMLKFLDEHCKTYGNAYDFLYLPMDFSKGNNLGYAFVNFTTSMAAVQCQKVLNKYRWDTVYTEKGRIVSSKICEIRWARVQGKMALVDRFKDSKFQCNREEFLPVILDPPRDGLDPDPSSPVTLGKMQL